MNNKKENKERGLLINKAGNNRYTTPDSIDNLVKYISRESNPSKKDLICQGTLGAIDFNGTNTVIEQFKCVQTLHTRKGDFGRYIDHEIYSLSNDELQSLKEKNIPLDYIAKELAKDFYKDGYQVFYGVHQPDDTEKHTHIHFAVNTVNYHTGNKRRENIEQTKRRGKRLHQIIKESINK